VQFAEYQRAARETSQLRLGGPQSVVAPMLVLQRTRDRYPRQLNSADLDELPVLDAAYPAHERFPRRLVVAFAEQPLLSGRSAAVLTLVDAQPNVFPEGPIDVEGGKVRASK
jgi:hypothetical protein